MTEGILFPEAFPILYTERLQLIEIKQTDSGSIHEFLSNEEVRKYIGIPAYKTIEETEKEIQWYNKIFKEQSGIRWGIARFSEPTIIGTCGFLNISKENFRGEIGYELHQNFWGKGIMGEALNQIIKYGFEEMGFNRIEALIEPENNNSIKLIEKLNFMKEGLLRQYEFGAGKFDDLYMYSLLADKKV